jgi:hypothetical protein
MAEQRIESPANRIIESVTCEVCGKFGAVEFGDRSLCPDCYQSCGSCCSEAVQDEREV